MPDRCFIGVDVGTGSARAGVFDSAGALLGTAKHAIATWHEAGEIVEQSSDDIWQAVAAAVRGAVSQSRVAPRAIAGLGFAATCSLVVVDQRGGRCRSARPRIPRATSSSGWTTGHSIRRVVST